DVDFVGGVVEAEERGIDSHEVGPAVAVEIGGLDAPCQRQVVSRADQHAAGLAEIHVNASARSREQVGPAVAVDIVRREVEPGTSRVAPAGLKRTVSIAEDHRESKPVEAADGEIQVTVAVEVAGDE